MNSIVAINSRAILFLIALPVGLMGLVQMIFAILSLAVFDDHHEVDFFYPSLVMLVISVIFLRVFRGFDLQRIDYRDSMLFATATWLIMGILGAIPIYEMTRVSWTDAMFESISGLTTTGATILSGLDHMPRSFLMYRQFLQWLGGLGVVIFVVAALPKLNIGGMKLLRAETPGPFKDDKFTPRLVHTAHYLWIVYLVITVLCAAGYFAVGMDTYDAIAHSLTTVSTGGFSTHDSSLGYFRSHTILWMAEIFMLLGSISFVLHFRVYKARSLAEYWRDEETRIFLYLVFVLSLVIIGIMLANQSYGSLYETITEGSFYLVSFITSTGYGDGTFRHWPYSVSFLLVFASYLGGCAGSTAGGNKIIRNILSVKGIVLEVKRLIHPKGTFMIKYSNKPVDSHTLRSVTSFMFIAALSTVVLTIGLMLTGMDFWTSLTAVAACLNVLGPAFGELGVNFQPLSDAGTNLMSMAMILGRLEYFTVLALFFPDFWRS